MPGFNKHFLQEIKRTRDFPVFKGTYPKKRLRLLLFNVILKDFTNIIKYVSYAIHIKMWFFRTLTLQRATLHCVYLKFVRFFDHWLSTFQNFLNYISSAEILSIKMMVLKSKQMFYACALHCTMNVPFSDFYCKFFKSSFKKSFRLAN